MFRFHGIFLFLCLAFLLETCAFLSTYNPRLKDFSVLFEQSRRRLLKNVVGKGLIAAGAGASTSTLVLFHPSHHMRATAAALEEESTYTPLADLPMTRLKLPQNALGREYVVVPLKIGEEGPFDFMVDSGLTTEMITPHLKEILKIQTGGNSKTIRGLAAGGGKENLLVELKNSSLCCGEFANGRSFLPLPPLHAVVTDFPQEHIDPNHDVEGMLGMELLELFDVDFDFPKGRIRFWPAKKSPKDNLVRIPAAVLNESGLEGIRVRSPQQKIGQPMLGIIDCGASFSTVNLAAANLLGLPTDPRQYRTPSVMGMGIDGKPMVMPTATVQFSFTGNAIRNPTTGSLGFEEPPSNFKPWDEIIVAVGDLPVFSDLLGDGKNPYPIPTVLIGLDLLSQRRIIMESGEGRARNIYVAPK